MIRDINGWFNAEEVEAYWKLTKLFRTPTEIMEVFKGLIYTKDNVQPLIDGSTKKPVYFIKPLIYGLI
jgi:hypothetical protein